MEQDMHKKNGFILFLEKIWPPIYRILNTVFYSTFKIITNGIKSAIEQIKGSF